MSTAKRGDLVIVVSTSKLSYLPGPGTTRARLYLVQSIDDQGLVRSVRTDAASPVRQLKTMPFEEIVVIDSAGLDVAAALLAAPFEGFDSLEEAQRYAESFRSS